jgi:hypothetical protein
LRELQVSEERFEIVRTAITGSLQSLEKLEMLWMMTRQVLPKCLVELDHRRNAVWLRGTGTEKECD